MRLQSSVSITREAKELGRSRKLLAATVGDLAMLFALITTYLFNGFLLGW